MSNADRLKGFLSDFKKSGSTKVTISGDDEGDTASLLGGLNSWTAKGLSTIKGSLNKVQETLPTSVKVRENDVFEQLIQRLAKSRINSHNDIWVCLTHLFA